MLTEVKLRQAKPKDKPYKLPDGRGLYVLVAINGGKYWRYMPPYWSRVMILLLKGEEYELGRTRSYS